MQIYANNVLKFIIGLLAIIKYELKKMLKTSYISYIWFIFLFSISIYILSGRNYENIEITRSMMSFKYGDKPMGDIIIFISSFIVSSGSSIFSGMFPDVKYPISIGIVFYMLGPMMIGLVLMSKFAIKKAAATFSREKENKTLYILVTSLQTRVSIFTSKFITVFILTIPIILFMYFITYNIFSSLFPEELYRVFIVLKASIITSLLFIAIGMAISVRTNKENKARWIGTKLVFIMTLLTSLWILIPLIEFILNVIDKTTYILTFIEKFTQISPLTMDLISIYNPSVSNFYFNIQIILIIIFFIIGLMSFMRQDID